MRGWGWWSYPGRIVRKQLAGDGDTEGLESPVDPTG